MAKGVFVTATGTDVGKTLVVACLIRHFLSRKMNCMMMKPVQTGAVPGPEGLMCPLDIDFVQKAAGLRVFSSDYEKIAPYLYEPPCSPDLAARLAGRPISIETIVKLARELMGRYEVLVMEGAGGIMVPLNEREMMRDLMAAVGFPVILVAHAGLGTINHVLLSLESLRTAGVPVLGVILNETCPQKAQGLEQLICDENVAAIEKHGKTRILARLPYLGSPIDWKPADEALQKTELWKEFV